jgi:hypothetical protein
MHWNTSLTILLTLIVPMAAVAWLGIALLLRAKDDRARALACLTLAVGWGVVVACQLYLVRPLLVAQ